MLSKVFGCRVIHNGRVASNDVNLGDGERLTSNQPCPLIDRRTRFLRLKICGWVLPTHRGSPLWANRRPRRPSHCDKTC